MFDARKPGPTHCAIDDAEYVLTAARVALAAQKSRSAELWAELAATTTRATALEAELIERATRINALERSTSWRLTAPLRALRRR